MCRVSTGPVPVGPRMDALVSDGSQLSFIASTDTWSVVSKQMTACQR